jgi:hypothetical protein
MENCSARRYCSMCGAQRAVQTDVAQVYLTAETPMCMQSRNKTASNSCTPSEHHRVVTIDVALKFAVAAQIVGVSLACVRAMFYLFFPFVALGRIHF